MEHKQIVRLLLKYTETMSHEGRLIQIIPNGYIEDIADEIEAIVNKNSVIACVFKLEELNDLKTYAGFMSDMSSKTYLYSRILERIKTLNNDK